MNSDKYKTKLFFNKISFLLVKNFNFLIIIIVFLSLLFIIIVILKPKYSNIQEKVEEFSVITEEEYPEKIKRYKRLSEYIDVYNEIEAREVEKIDTMLSEQGVREELFTRLESIIKKNGLILVSIVIKDDSSTQKSVSKKSLALGEVDEGERSVSSKIGKIKTDLSITGVDYIGLKNLLKVFENSIKIMDIEHISFSPSNESLELQVSSYYYK